MTQMEIDITGTVITPGKPDECQGNGSGAAECCCDECDYLLECFPELSVTQKDIWNRE